MLRRSRRIVDADTSMPCDRRNSLATLAGEQKGRKAASRFFSFRNFGVNARLVTISFFATSDAAMVARRRRDSAGLGLAVRRVCDGGCPR